MQRALQSADSPQEGTETGQSAADPLTRRSSDFGRAQTAPLPRSARRCALLHAAAKQSQIARSTADRHTTRHNDIANTRRSYAPERGRNPKRPMLGSWAQLN